MLLSHSLLNPRLKTEKKNKVLKPHRKQGLPLERGRFQIHVDCFPLRLHPSHCWDQAYWGAETIQEAPPIRGGSNMEIPRGVPRTLWRGLASPSRYASTSCLFFSCFPLHTYQCCPFVCGSMQTPIYPCPFSFARSPDYFHLHPIPGKRDSLFSSFSKKSKNWSDVCCVSCVLTLR